MIGPSNIASSGLGWSAPLCYGEQTCHYRRATAPVHEYLTRQPL